MVPDRHGRHCDGCGLSAGSQSPSARPIMHEAAEMRGLSTAISFCRCQNSRGVRPMRRLALARLRYGEIGSMGDGPASSRPTI